MAKSKKNEAEAETATEAEAPKVDKRYIFVKDPETGEEVKRGEYIKRCCSPESEGGKGMSRSECTKHIQAITGDEDFRYQIVFQATKGMSNIKASTRGKKKADTDADADAEAEA